jgi:predicted transcriptional regulator
MKVLLSIKPEFADKIFLGIKKYEFRKSIFKNRGINKVIVYASSPISKIVGEFDIESILHEELNILWEETKEHAGIEKQYFYNYFSKKDFGFAIKIKSFKKYDIPINIQTLGKTPPQSFLYLN